MTMLSEISQIPKELDVFFHLEHKRDMLIEMGMLGRREEADGRLENKRR